MSRLFHGSLAFVAALTVVVSISGCWSAKISAPLGPILRPIVIASLFLPLAAFYRWRRVPKLQNLAMVTFWGISLNSLYIYPMYFVARQPAIMGDELLAKIDRALGLEVTDVLTLVEGHPGWRTISQWVYDSLMFFMIVAIVLPVLRGQFRRTTEFVVGCVFAAMVSMAFCSCFQAVGPWSLYGYAPDFEQARYTRIFMELKGDQPFYLSLENTTGIMTIPSFHTILALLSAVALWQTPWVRWPAAMLGGAICLSTLLTGWHYITDVLAGILITAISVGAARLFTRVEARFYSTAATQAVPTPAPVASPKLELVEA